jgi:hypothetical protein
MSQDQEKMKAMLALKQRLEKRIAELDAEGKELQATLDTVNSILLEKGFRRGNLKDAEALERAESKEAPVQPEPSKTEAAPRETRPLGYHGGEPENVIPLKTANEESLAIIYVEKDSVHILPDESKHFSVNTPPFSNFLVERVFAKMQDKDSELVRLKQLTPDKMFSYNIVREGEFIREIVIRNVDEERFRELKSSIRWTLEKMYEKMKSPQQ